MSSVTLGAPRHRRVDDGGLRGGVVLIGFQDQGNLGMGYLASSLEAYRPSRRAHRVPRRRGGARSRAYAQANPVVVGFSLIFQYYIRRYRTLIQRLRAAGIDAHFTMGGHYPSLCPDETLDPGPRAGQRRALRGRADPRGAGRRPAPRRGLARRPRHRLPGATERSAAPRARPRTSPRPRRPAPARCD